MTKTEESMEAKLKASFSLNLLCLQRPDISDLLKQAYKAGFADGALWQAIQIRDLTEDMREAA